MSNPTEAPVGLPTATAPPVASPTPEPPTATPTAAVPPTPDPNEGVGEVVFKDNLDGTGNWYWTFEDDAAAFGVSGEQKQLNATAKQSGTWRFVISNDSVSVGNQQLRVTAHTNVCADADEYALLFRGSVDAEFNYSFYALKLRCDGAMRLERMQGNDVFALTEWATFSAVHAGPNAANALMVWAKGGEMRFYANDQYLFTAQDTTLAAGFYGFLLYDRTNGTMSVSWKGLEVKAVAP
jgi:hypothetical protein